MKREGHKVPHPSGTGANTPKTNLMCTSLDPASVPSRCKESFDDGIHPFQVVAQYHVQLIEQYLNGEGPLPREHKVHDPTRPLSRTSQVLRPDLYLGRNIVEKRFGRRMMRESTG